MTSKDVSTTDLLIEPLRLSHLSMLGASNETNILGTFQILLYKKWISYLESNLINIFHSRNSTCFVAIEKKDIVSYILATPTNKRGTCWSISQPYFICNSISHSRYNIFQKLLKEIIYENKIKTKSFLVSIDTKDSQSLSIVRQSGFQPLRIIKYWKRRDKSLNEIIDNKNKLYWEKLNHENAYQIWRLEQARESINIRSIFDRQWQDIYDNRNSITGVIKTKEDQVIGGLIPSICPQKSLSLELIRGLAWDERLIQLIPRRINDLPYEKETFLIETSSQDNNLNELLIHNNCEVIEERVLLGRSIWKRQSESKLKAIDNKLLSNIVGNLQQQPELPSPLISERR
tara:strand:- start:357 stop:1391 length:1035 start_codon:yes stop_codon:yes gene_type:complete